MLNTYTTEQQAKIDAMSEEEKELWIDFHTLIPCSYSISIDDVECKQFEWHNVDVDSYEYNLIMVQLRRCLRALGYKIDSIRHCKREGDSNNDLEIIVYMPHYLYSYGMGLYNEYIRYTGREFPGDDDSDNDDSDDDDSDDDIIDNNLPMDESSTDDDPSI